jgi:hypothetical protein
VTYASAHRKGRAPNLTPSGAVAAVAYPRNASYSREFRATSGFSSSPRDKRRGPLDRASGSGGTVAAQTEQSVGMECVGRPTGRKTRLLVWTPEEERDSW